jgi:ATP-dependent DNA helicase RecG
MFDDRLVIESPGGFPPLVTPENIYQSQQARNPRLMDVMFYLKYVRAAREGARRMRDSMNAMKLPSPEFSSKDLPKVEVTLRNHVKQRRVLLDSGAIDLVGAKVFRSLTQDERRAINYVAEHGSINVSELMRITQRSWHHSKQVLEALKKRELFVDNRRPDIQRDSNARYRLKDP